MWLLMASINLHQVIVHYHHFQVMDEISLYRSCPQAEVNGGDGGATRPFPRDGSVEELHRDPTVGPRPKVWTSRSQSVIGIATEFLLFAILCINPLQFLDSTSFLSTYFDPWCYYQAIVHWKKKLFKSETVNFFSNMKPLKSFSFHLKLL